MVSRLGLGASTISPDLVHNPMIGDNRQLVTYELVSLSNNRLKFKTAGKLPITLEESIEYTQFNK